jgi:hypothetical protein
MPNLTLLCTPNLLKKGYKSFPSRRPGLAIGQTGQMPDGPDARWAGRQSGELDELSRHLLNFDKIAAGQTFADRIEKFSIALG